MKIIVKSISIEWLKQLFTTGVKTAVVTSGALPRDALLLEVKKDRVSTMVKLIFLSETEGEEIQEGRDLDSYPISETILQGVLI